MDLRTTCNDDELLQFELRTEKKDKNKIEKNANKRWNKRRELMHPFLMKFICFGFRSEMRAHLPSVCWWILFCLSSTMCAFVWIRVNNFIALTGCAPWNENAVSMTKQWHIANFPDDLHRRNDENWFSLRHSYTFAAEFEWRKKNHFWHINKFRNMQLQCAACDYSDVNRLANRISFFFFVFSLAASDISILVRPHKTTQYQYACASKNEINMIIMSALHFVF